MTKRTYVIVLVILLGLAAPSFAQIVDDGRETEEAQPISYPYGDELVSHPGEGELPDSQLESAGEQMAISFSGIGYYTAPNSDGIQSFPITDDSLFLGTSAAVQSDEDTGRRAATDR